jgi:glycerol-3-phosphate acyltransferase PlsY
MLRFAAALIGSYILGSIPAAYIAGRARGIDLRKHGSGNLGATNVIRVLGARIGLLVFAFDMLKGAVPVVFFPRWVSPDVMPMHDPLIFGILCGVCAIAGHTRPVFLGLGKGGKGVATAAGVFLALAPVQTLLVLAVFSVVLWSSGYVSLGSLTCATLLPVLLWLTVGARSPLFVISLLLAVFVFWTHRANIQRLRTGQEHRFGDKKNGSKRPNAIVPIALVVAAAIVIAARFG